jgi:hypothetical protein
LIKSITTSYNGMTPMERFFAETYEGKVEAQGIQTNELVSDSGATYAGSSEVDREYYDNEAGHEEQGNGQ